MCEVCCISASATGPDVLFGVGYCHQPAILTGVTGEGVGALHQPLLCKFSHSVRDYTIALHFRFYLAQKGIYTQRHRYQSLT